MNDGKRSGSRKRVQGRKRDASRSSLSRRQLMLTALGGSAAAVIGRFWRDHDRASAAVPAMRPQPGGELVYGMSSKFDTLDPNVTTFSQVERIGNLIFDPLIRETKPGVFMPGLAERWEVNAAADQYTFYLRRDVKFHDGTPFDAAAVKFTFDRIVDPALKSQEAFSAIGPYESTSVVDPYTVTVKFKKPYAPFPSSVAQSLLAPVSPAAVKKYGADFGAHPVGTGPFKFDAYTIDTEVRLVRNPDYNWAPAIFAHQGPAYLDRVTFRIIPDSPTRVAALRAREVQIIEDVPTQDYQVLQRDASIQTLTGWISGSGWSMMCNVTRPPMDDVRVRQALAWGADRAGMNKAVWRGVYGVASSPLTRTTFGWDPATINVYGYDAKKAGALLDEAGWKMGPGGVRQKDGQPLTLGTYYRADNYDFTGMATFCKSMYAPLGINIDLHGLSQGGYFDAVRAGQHHIQYWWNPWPDPDVVRVLFYSANANGGTNRNRYKNAEMDQLIDQAAGTVNPVQRRALYAEIQLKALREAIMVYFTDSANLFAYQKNNVNGATLDWWGEDMLFYDAWVKK